MIINANALHVPLADRSVQCIVTSPPYWGLRDYGTAKWEGGDPECKHVVFQKKDLSSGLRNDGRTHKGLYEGEKATEITEYYRSICGKCGAIRIDNQLGLERTPEEYIANMVAVFRECWRVLRDDGTLWLNVGDSYSGNTNPGSAQSDKTTMTGGRKLFDISGKSIPDNLKPKDLVGIPWRLAFALQADGWYLRSDVIWSKPNPMPESVTDRPTKSHEYLFLLAKQERYYYDAEAIREAWADERQGCDYPQVELNGRGGGIVTGQDPANRSASARPERERNRGGRIDGFTKPNNINHVFLNRHFRQYPN